MRRSSGEQNPHGFRTDSASFPYREERRKPGMGMGMGSRAGKKDSRTGSYKEWKPDSAQEQAPFTERRAREFAFAAKALPEQHPGFAVVAMIAIQMKGQTPTRENVLERLTEQGREASQIGYGPGGYAA